MPSDRPSDKFKITPRTDEVGVDLKALRSEARAQAFIDGVLGDHSSATRIAVRKMAEGDAPVEITEVMATMGIPLKEGIEKTLGDKLAVRLEQYHHLIDNQNGQPKVAPKDLPTALFALGTLSDETLHQLIDEKGQLNLRRGLRERARTSEPRRLELEVRTRLSADEASRQELSSTRLTTTGEVKG